MLLSLCRRHQFPVGMRAGVGHPARSVQLARHPYQRCPGVHVDLLAEVQLREEFEVVPAAEGEVVVAVLAVAHPRSQSLQHSELVLEQPEKHLL